MTENKSVSSIAHIKSKIKVVFLGDQTTGKTSILLRFMHDKFEQAQAPTVGIDFMAKNVMVNTTNLRLQLWDTAGQQRFRSLIPSYLKDATIAFIIFDITNLRSFQNVKEWIQICNQNKKQGNITVLIGSKADLKQERQVTYEMAQKFAQNQGFTYFEVSAKTNSNIKQMFKYAMEQYVNQAFGNEVTIGNLQSLHKNLSTKINEKHKKHQSSVVLNEPIKNTKEKQKNKKKTGCC